MNPDFQNLLKKVEDLKKSGKFDLSLEEDLSIAIMNLISLEEHFFFTAQKTAKDSYLDLLKQIRVIRKQLLAKMIDQHEGETWCIAKHLLAASMRLIEVGTKYQTDDKPQEAKAMFTASYEIYILFWALRLKLVSPANIKSNLPATKEPWSLSDIVTKLVDCCKE